jgi:RNA polymerase sigma factor (sigma-70 family)
MLEKFTFHQEGEVMVRPHTELLLQHIQRLAGRDAAGGLSDAELLRHFLGEGDETAFTALVQRHGAMVWQVCLSALGQREDAEDVFQATFLVLARKAGSVRKQESLACWLHSVAFCLARKVRGRNLRRRTNAAEALDGVAARPMEDLTWRELRQVLHEELGRLPEKNRLPLLLCHLEGRTQDEAARALGWSLGQLRGRLLRGRELLRRRLARRGLAPSVPLLAAALFPGEADATPPEPLVGALGQSLAALARHETAPAAGPLALADRFIRESALFWKKVAVTVVVCLAPLLGILGLLAHQPASVPRSPQSADKAPAVKLALAQDGKGQGQVLKDQLGDVLPADALLRLGTLRFRSGGVIHTLAFAGDGKSLLCSGWNKGICRWDPQTGAELEPWTGSEKGFLDAAVSADGKILVGGTVDGNLHVWDLTAGKEIKKIAVPGGKTIRHVAVAPDGRTAAVAGDDNPVRLLDLTTGAHRVLITYKEAVSCVAFSPDGKLLASASYDGTAHVHEADTGKVVCQPKPKKGVLVSLCFAPDSKTLLAGESNSFSGDGNPLSFWDVPTGQLQRRLEDVAGQLAVIRFAPDGKTIAGGTSQGVIHIWETAAVKQLHKIKAHADNVHALGFSADGGVLASGGSEHGVFLWDTKSGKQRNTLIGHQERVTAVAVAPGGKVIATAGWDHSIRLWDADTGQELRRLGWTPREKVPLGTSQAIGALIFSPDGKWLVAAGYEDKVWLWDLAKGEPARTFPGNRAALSPDGKHLVTADWGGVARLYEIGTGKEVRQFKGHLSGITYLHFTPDGQTLVTASVGPPLGFRGGDEKWDKQAIWVWDVATGKVRLQFGGESRPGGLALSPDGRTLSASGLNEKVVHLWELATGKERAALHGHGDMLFATAFTPDGMFLASGSMDQTVRLWRLPGGKHAHTFAGHRGWVLDLAFTPDGKKLVSGSLDTTGLVWKMPSLAQPQEAKLMPADVAKLWDDLASADAQAAYQAIAALAAAPGQAVPFLSEKLKPAAAPDPALVAQLIADLDSKNFAARQKAAAALEKLAELVVLQLRAALEKPLALEAAQRIEKILDLVARQPLPAEKLRDLRAVEALESIATPNARAVLQALGQGAAGAHLTRDAQAALLRLGKGPAPKNPGANHQAPRSDF